MTGNNKIELDYSTKNKAIRVSELKQLQDYIKDNPSVEVTLNVKNVSQGRQAKIDFPFTTKATNGDNPSLRNANYTVLADE